MEPTACLLYLQKLTQRRNDDLGRPNDHGRGQSRPGSVTCLAGSVTCRRPFTKRAVRLAPTSLAHHSSLAIFTAGAYTGIVLGSGRLMLVVAALVASGCSEPYQTESNDSAAGPSSMSTTGSSPEGTSAAGGTASAAGGTLSPAGGGGGLDDPRVTVDQCDGINDPASDDPVAMHDECNGQSEVAVPESPGKCVLWTGSGYLTAFADARGIMVALLDEAGTVISEENLSVQTVEHLSARLSRNGNRVLLALAPGSEGSAAFAVLDLQGVPLTTLQVLGGDDYPQVFDFAAAPMENDWLVAFGYNNPSPGRRGIFLARISAAGVVEERRNLEVWGYPYSLRFAPRTDGQMLLLGTYDTGGQFGAQYGLAYLFDNALDVVSCALGG